MSDLHEIAAHVNAIRTVAARMEENLRQARDTAHDDDRAEWIDLALGDLDALTLAACNDAAELASARAQLEQLRDAVLACIGDAEGQEAVEQREMLELTKGQVQLLASAISQESAPRVSVARNAAGELLSGGFAGLCAHGPVEVGAAVPAARTPEGAACMDGEGGVCGECPSCLTPDAPEVGPAREAVSADTPERIAVEDVREGDVLDITYVSPEFGHDTVRREVVSVEDGRITLRAERGTEYEWRHPNDSLSVYRVPGSGSVSAVGGEGT